MNLENGENVSPRALGISAFELAKAAYAVPSFHDHRHLLGVVTDNGRTLDLEGEHIGWKGRVSGSIPSFGVGPSIAYPLHFPTGYRPAVQLHYGI